MKYENIILMGNLNSEIGEGRMNIFVTIIVSLTYLPTYLLAYLRT